MGARLATLPQSGGWEVPPGTLPQALRAGGTPTPKLFEQGDPP